MTPEDATAALDIIDAWEREHENRAIRDAIQIYRHCADLESRGVSVAEYFRNELFGLAILKMNSHAHGGEA